MSTAESVWLGQLGRFAADAGGDPWAVTTDDLVAWLGGQAGWATETKR